LYDFLTFDKNIKEINNDESNEPTSFSSVQGNSKKAKLNKFFKTIDTRNGFLCEKIFLSNNLTLFQDKLKRKQLLRLDSQYDRVSPEHYVQFININHTAFKSLSSLKYQKIKTVFCCSCGDLLGFLFREIFNEILHTCLEIQDKQNATTTTTESQMLTSAYVFEACRLMQASQSSILNEIDSFKSSKKNFKKKYLFF
jgi:hypothetical protein